MSLDALMHAKFAPYRSWQSCFKMTIACYTIRANEKAGMNWLKCV